MARAKAVQFAGIILCLGPFVFVAAMILGAGLLPRDTADPLDDPWIPLIQWIVKMGVILFPIGMALIILGCSMEARRHPLNVQRPT